MGEIKIEVKRPGDIIGAVDSDAVRAFVADARAALTGAEDETIYVRDKALSKELGVKFAPFCGVYLRDSGDIDCDALVGPSADGAWRGLTIDGEDVTWSREDVF